MQHSAARFVKNDYRRNTNPADLIRVGWGKEPPWGKKPPLYFQDYTCVMPVSVGRKQCFHLETTLSESTRRQKTRLVKYMHFKFPCMFDVIFLCL